MWTIERALIVVRNLNKANLHWNFALAGGVLNKGYSYHDLDIITYPDRPEAALDKLYSTLNHFGWTRTHNELDMIKSWRAKGSDDNKWVEVWQTMDNKRVDVIIPSLKAGV